MTKNLVLIGGGEIKGWSFQTKDANQKLKEAFATIALRETEINNLKQQIKIVEQKLGQKEIELQNKTIKLLNKNSTAGNMINNYFKSKNKDQNQTQQL